MRAAALLRVSTDAQAESGWGLPEQRAAITEYCRRHGIDLVELCEDDGVSGRQADRPAVRRALELARAGAIDTLVLLKLDRLGRENRVIQDLLHRFRSLGLSVRFVEHTSGDTASDRLLLNVLGGVAEWELEAIRARTMAGRRRKAESGRMPAAFAALGYHCVRTWEEAADPSRISGTLEINEAEATLVRELFRRYADGETLNGLVNWLNAAGHRTRRGNEWRVTTLKVLLENPLYKGEARYGWRSVRTYMARDEAGERKRHQTRREEDWVTIPCPALVTPETWDAVQTRIREVQGQVRGRPSVVWPLRGCVRCLECKGKRGAPTVALGQRRSTNPQRKAYKQRYYVCPGCKGQLTAAKWERKALQFLRDAVAPGVQGAQARKLAEQALKAAGDVDLVIERYQAELRALDQEERKLLSAALHFSPHIVAEQAAGLRLRRDAANLALQQALIERRQWEEPETAAAEAERRAENVRRLLEHVEDDPERLQQVFREYVRITLRRGKSPLVDIRV
jgi:DNA invertase Pin-like site-specific DNA recombinase